MQSLIEYHDNWLGKLPAYRLTELSHPFFEALNVVDDNLQDLAKLGFLVVDVLGDGNCGYYSIILGLENLGKFEYSERNPVSTEIPMLYNTPWQNCVMRLRRALQEHSRTLLRNEYPPRRRNYAWFLLIIGAIEKQDFAELSDEFHTDLLSQEMYFNESLTKKKVKGCPLPERNYMKYQMSPYWATYVLSSLLSIRVIVYTRTEASDDEPVAWSTTVLHHNAPKVEQRVKQIPSLLRISDENFKQYPTVELFYFTWLAGGGHFQFLRRVLCDDSDGRNTSPETLMHILRRTQKNQSKNSVHDKSSQHTTSVSRTPRGKAIPKSNPKTVPKSKLKSGVKHKKPTKPTIESEIVPCQQPAYQPYTSNTTMVTA